MAMFFSSFPNSSQKSKNILSPDLKVCTAKSVSKETFRLSRYSIFHARFKTFKFRAFLMLSCSLISALFWLDLPPENVRKFELLISGIKNWISAETKCFFWNKFGCKGQNLILGDWHENTSGWMILVLELYFNVISIHNFEIKDFRFSPSGERYCHLTWFIGLVHWILENFSSQKGHGGARTISLAQ